MYKVNPALPADNSISSTRAKKDPHALQRRRGECGIGWRSGVEAEGTVWAKVLAWEGQWHILEHSKEKVMREATGEGKDGQGLAGPHKDSNFIPK